MSSLWNPRPGQNEARVHNAAIRDSFALPCELQHLQIPLSTGFDDDDEPIIEMKEWPFILPHLLVWYLVFTTYIWSTTSKSGPSKSITGWTFCDFGQSTQVQSMVDMGPFVILGNQLRSNPWWIWGIWSYLLTLSVYRSIGPTSSKIFQGIQQKLQQQHPFPWHSMATLLKPGGMT